MDTPMRCPTDTNEVHAASTAHRSTRGHGLLEDFLARQRYQKAHLLLRQLSKCQSVLDLGCGQYPVFLSQLQNPIRVGIDRGPVLPNVPGIHLIRQDLNDDATIHYPDLSFDAVTMLATLEHLDPTHIIRLLTDVHRVLRPGGRFVFTTPHVIGGPVLWAMARMGFVSREEIDEHNTLLTCSRLRQLMRTAGFADARVRISTFEAGMNMYGFAEK